MPWGLRQTSVTLSLVYDMDIGFGVSCLIVPAPCLEWNNLVILIIVVNFDNSSGLPGFPNSAHHYRLARIIVIYLNGVASRPSIITPSSDLRIVCP